MRTKIWRNLEKAKILAIGHDPGLQRSPTIADYCFFADYYFRFKPSKKSELANIVIPVHDPMFEKVWMVPG